jgi:outer membrane protein TolC
LKRLSEALAFTVSILAAAVAAPYAYASSLTLAEAWQEVLQQDDNLAAGQAAQQRAAALLSNSTSLLLPQIDLVGSYTRLESPVELDALALNPLSSAAESVPGQLLIDALGGPDAFRTPVTNRDISRSSLAMFWPLYTGGKITTARELLQLGDREAELLVEEIRHARFLALVQVYYGLVMAERALITQQQAEQTLSRHFASAQAMEDQFQIARVERLAAQAAYDKARITTGALRDQRDGARETLASMVHYQPVSTSESQQGPQPDSPLFTIDAMPMQAELQAGLSNHPGIQLLATKRAQAESITRASRGLYQPDVFLFGSYNLYENDSLASDLSPDWLLGVGVRMPLFDRQGPRGKIQAAQSTVDEVGYLQQATERRLALLFNQQYRDARHALVEYRELASTQALAEETLRLQELAFAEGLGRALDVIDAQTFLSATRTRRDAAAFRFVVSLAQVLSLSGQSDQLFVYLDQGEPIP